MKTIAALAPCWLAIAVVLATMPQHAEAQRGEGRIALGFGWSRFTPTRPIASAEATAPQYKLDAASASVVDLDYWYKRWIGTRLSYQWLSTDLAEPEGPSFARIYAIYLGALLSPGQVVRGVQPFVSIGGGFRRYDVSALATVGGQTREIAPRQNRPAAYAGAGVAVRTPWIWLVPEAGVYANSFKHDATCQTCSNERDSQLDIVLSIKAQFR